MLLYTFYPTFEKCYENVMCLLGSCCALGQDTLISFAPLHSTQVNLMGCGPVEVTG